MIPIKDDVSISKMQTSGQLLSTIFEQLSGLVASGVSTRELDAFIERELNAREMVSGSKGYNGFRHSSCISINDEVVHGVPSTRRVIRDGDLVKIDICAAYGGFYADMARSFVVGSCSVPVRSLVETAHRALDAGIEKMAIGMRLSDVSAAIQGVAEAGGYGVVRDFAGHGIGRSMHEEPEILNYGVKGKGPVLKKGMAFALEPMITMGDCRVVIARDGWTVKTVDGGLAAHVEDTIVIADDGPIIITR